MATGTEHFYENIPPFQEFSEFTNPRRYWPLPEDWLIVVADVKGSTRAVEAGKYKQVNATGAATIVAVLNAIKPLKVPYVFGGDGATLCVPGKFRENVENALIASCQMSRNAFDLELRAGLIPMSDLVAAERQVLVGRFQPTEHFQQAMFLGDGIHHATALTKDRAPNNPYLVNQDYEVTDAASCFEGFECRWNEVPSPNGETVSLIVHGLAEDEVKRAQIYAIIMQGIAEIYGNEKEYQPIREQDLSLTLSVRRLGTEARVRTAFSPKYKRWLYVLKTWFLALAGKLFMKKKVKNANSDWGNYKPMLVANSDYRKCDECIYMVLSGNAEQRTRLRKKLETLHAKGHIVFGMHVGRGALVTCLVNDYNRDHVHFLDGADGGYAMASVELKDQLRALPG